MFYPREIIYIVSNVAYASHGVNLPLYEYNIGNLMVTSSLHFLYVQAEDPKKN